MDLLITNVPIRSMIIYRLNFTAINKCHNVSFWGLVRHVLNYYILVMICYFLFTCSVALIAHQIHCMNEANLMFVTITRVMLKC